MSLATKEPAKKGGDRHGAAAKHGHSSVVRLSPHWEMHVITVWLGTLRGKRGPANGESPKCVSVC